MDHDEAVEVPEMAAEPRAAEGSTPPPELTSLNADVHGVEDWLAAFGRLLHAGWRPSVRGDFHTTYAEAAFESDGSPVMAPKTVMAAIHITLRPPTESA